jgi:radical SAM modification target selenobiotic family peptide
MGKDKLKQLLTGLSIAGLMAGAGITAPGPVLGGSG